jgi:hypothetical protein
MGSSLGTISGSSWDHSRLTRVAALAVAGGVLLLLIGWAVFGMVVPQQCSYQEIDGVGSFALITASIGGFVAGHVLGRWFESSPGASPWPRSDPAMPAHGQGAHARTKRISGALLVQTALVLFLLLSTALLAYETLALVNIDRNWPITYFVRCFTNSNPVCAGVGSFTFCFLLGHWIWYPAGGERG